MRRQGLLVSFVAGCLWCLLSWLPFSQAEALTPIKIYDLSYEKCPAEMQGIVTSGSNRGATCYLIKGKAKNMTNKLIVDADVFGRIYDGNGSPTFENRGRVGTIMEVPPGVSDFEIPVSVAANQPEPLELKQFKASGFTSQVRPFYYDNDDI
ncbi:hypothetical protein Lepto7376_2123 [[Leptolyngbya] sp. PCC 7376]|uniref:hypothetical protein n=1 Tax=[Leptolyngbya] sp. PCC 7376 TaxID=111781 RepID=UPI00029EF493|nr:hypothetical protein [[Leptolyngbya] sp. PCC 7376]AFY38421.1 hypothetical protein Lepto7376_2123 [[Leptolyngbya] sp. PCC 7376]